MKWKPNRIPCRITKRFQLQSRFTITLLPSDDGNWQSIYIYKSSTVQQIFKKREIAVSDQSSPTNKSKAHQQAVYWDTHREVYREVHWQVYQVDPDSTEAVYRESTYEVNRMVTEADFERRLPSTADYRQQDILYRACGSTAQSSDSASALVLGKYNHPREAYVLDIDEWDVVDAYDWRLRRMRQRKLPSMPGHERKLSTTLMNSDNDRRRDASYGSDGRWTMVRKWRYGGWDYFRMFLVSLFSPSLLWISARYKWRRHGFSPPSESIKWRWIFPMRQVRRKVAIKLYWSVVGRMCSYNCVRRINVPFFVSLSFVSLILALAAQEVCAEREG